LALYCLVLYSRDSKLDRQIADYVQRNHQALDGLFGPRLHGFAIGHQPGRKDERRAGQVYDVARMFGLGADQLPCALLSTTLERPRGRLLVSFDRFLPPADNREKDDISALFRAIAGASDRCADVPARRRVERLQRELRTARRNVYRERAAQAQALQRIADDSEALARIAKSGKTVAVVLAPLVSFLFGGTGVPGT
jgi:hypothetical protein